MHTYQEVYRETLRRAFLMILDNEPVKDRLLSEDVESLYIDYVALNIFRRWKVGDYSMLNTIVKAINRGGNINAPKD